MKRGFTIFIFALGCLVAGYVIGSVDHGGNPFGLVDKGEKADGAWYAYYKGNDGKWYLRLVAPNSEIIAIGSQGYQSESAVKRAIDTIRKHAATQRVIFGESRDDL